MEPRTLFALLGAWILFCTAHAPAQEPRECSAQYHNINMVDYGPLSVHLISGVAQDPFSVAVPEVCVALFTEKEHVPVTSAISDENGHYEMKGVKPGLYRLVATSPGFGASNAKLKVVRSSRHPFQRQLALHMKPRAIDVTSHGDYT